MSIIDIDKKLLQLTIEVATNVVRNVFLEETADSLLYIQQGIKTKKELNPPTEMELIEGAANHSADLQTRLSVMSEYVTDDELRNRLKKAEVAIQDMIVHFEKRLREEGH